MKKNKASSHAHFLIKCELWIQEKNNNNISLIMKEKII